MVVAPLPSVNLRGKGVELVRQGACLVYRKWVEAPKGLEPGSLVVIEDTRGEILGCGFYDTVGPVAIRVVWHKDCVFSTPDEVIEHHIERAYKLRVRLGLVKEKAGYRLVHSDGDLLPGLIVDVYDDIAVIQSSSIVWDVHMDKIVKALRQIVGVKHVYEKSTQRTRRDIGLEPRERLLAGWKTEAVIEEGLAKFKVDVRRGQKTGFFLDQRLNRLEVEKLVSNDDVILDLFSYTGGFGIHALVAGARKAVFVEIDEKAVQLLKENLKINGVQDKAEIFNENVWTFLRKCGEKFNVIIVDPPAFIQDKAHYERGKEAYYHLFRRALQLASENAIAFLSSCSTFLPKEEFWVIVNQALLATGREFRVLGSIRGLPPDHPYRINAEHLDYLKSVFVQLVE